MAKAKAKATPKKEPVAKKLSAEQKLAQIVADGLGSATKSFDDNNNQVYVLSKNAYETTLNVAKGFLETE
tara:strand:- start:727 stop:936 length:210 start_codon:yes stop_codon:yes gene_type:complete